MRSMSVFAKTVGRKLKTTVDMTTWILVMGAAPCTLSIRQQSLGPVRGRMDFPRIFIIEPPDFFADFLAGFFLLIFVGKSAQKNPPRKSPGKSSKIYTTKIPDTFLQRGRANKVPLVPVLLRPAAETIPAKLPLKTA